jgi:F-type H+-transporting ATPase subunit a
VTEPKKRKYVNRILFGIVLIVGYFAFARFKAFMPHIQLPAEPLHEHPFFTIGGQPFYFTNTMTSVVIAYVFILLIAWSIRKQIKAGKLVLDGIGGGVAGILEGFYTMTETTAGKHARKIFPYFATIFLLVLFVNLQELMPFTDTIGLLKPAEAGHEGYTVEQVAGLNVIQEVEEEASEGEHGELFSFFPFWRVASTDLNFTLSLAIISVIMTQVVGVSVLGAGYFTKYLNTHDVRESWKKPQLGNPLDFILGLVNTVVGFLEVVSEVSKVLSFTFRLFGVLFAGSVLLFFVGSMTGAIGQMGVFFLELLFGAIQAYVFGMLTMVFMSLATHSHAHAEEAH